MAQFSNCIQLTINFVTLSIYCDISCRSHNTFYTTLTGYHAQRVQAISHFARRYFGNHCYFLFVLLLRCFSSQAFLHYDYLIHHRIVRYKPYRVSPFGILGIKGFQRLPRAYRSFTRPSSAVGTKASTVSSLQLYLTYSRILTVFCSCGYFASASLSRFALLNYPTSHFNSYAIALLIASQLTSLWLTLSTLVILRVTICLDNILLLAYSLCNFQCTIQSISLYLRTESKISYQRGYSR